MGLSKKRKSSAKQAEANRQNGQKSNGPHTPEGKKLVSLNAIKHGLHTDPLYRAMLAIGEKPSEHLRVLVALFASLRPANLHQKMQVEDIARLRCEKLRLERAHLALIAAKMRGLDLKRDHRLLEFDSDAPDLPQAELLHKGLDRVPDCPPKFEKMLACLDVLISIAKQSQFTLDPEPELNLLYGEEPSLEGAYLRNVFRRFVAAQGGGVPDADSGTPEAHRQEAGTSSSQTSNPEPRIPNSEQERFLLLKTLFGAKQRALRRYQLYNREFVEITPDQRDACYGPSEDGDVQLMRLQAQNERQLRLALKTYWQTQKEDTARIAQLDGTTGEADALMADLSSELSAINSQNLEPGTQDSDAGPLPVSPAAGGGAPKNIFDERPSSQVVENTGEVSEIGQNNPNFGHPPSGAAIGESEKRENEKESPVAAFPVSPLASPESRIPNSAPLVEAARPKVKELLEQMQSDPEARALVETFLLNQMVQEESKQEEVEVTALQRERQKRETLEEGLEQMVAAQQELESNNRRLRACVPDSQLTHQQVQEQTKSAEAVVAERREPTREEIIEKIADAVGLRGPEEFLDPGE
jgi:hypothetical protein